MRVFHAAGSIFFTTLSAFLLSACAGDRGAASEPQVAASAEITESFGAGVDTKTGQTHLIIRKDALEKEFLLQSALIDQTVAAMGESLRSRIVAFKRNGSQVLLVEATAGHTVTTDLPQNLVLAAFPVSAETATTLQFDFNAGMSVIFASNEWTGHDSGGRDYSPAFQAATVRFSYLEGVRVTDANRLAIRQIAQVAMPIMGGSNLKPVEVRYFLSPYQPDPGFKPSGEADYKRAGFFEVAPRLRFDGSTQIHSVKFDASKPIVFAVSANTPADYRQAVKDGILYWKGALPTVQAVDAPEGVSAPDITHNIIQWVPHDRAGMAYADGQMDPRTGQVLHAQAFITSTFAFGGRNRARALLRRLDEPEAAPQSKLSLFGFGTERLCAMKTSESLQRSLGEMLATGASDAAILRVSQDYVRATVAHEVGHLLGLRHNFAGNLSPKNYSLEQRERIYENYLAYDRVPQEIETSSSEMDYLPLEESSLHGHQMRTYPGKMFAHDRIAIEMLYFGKDPALKDVPPFCTDGGNKRYTDCALHDAGQTPIEFAAHTSRKAVDTLPHRIIETFISVKAPAPWDAARTIESVNFDPEKVAANILEPLADVMKSFSTADKHSLLIAREFPFVGPLNLEEVQDRELQMVQKEVDRLGGWEKVFGVMGTPSYEAILDQTDKLLKDPAYRSGTGLGEQPYTFTATEIEGILNLVLGLVVKLPESITKADLAILDAIPTRWKATGTKTGDDLAKLAGQRANEYVLATHPKSFIEVSIEVPDETKSELGAAAISAPIAAAGDPFAPPATAVSAAPVAKTKTTKLKLPVFYFSSASREKAPKLLAPGSTPESIDWGFDQRASLKAELTKKLDAACGCEFTKTSADKFKIADTAVRRKVTRWFLENKRVLSAIP